MLQAEERFVLVDKHAWQQVWAHFMPQLVANFKKHAI